MLGTILISVMALASLGALPRRSRGQGWGYRTIGALGLFLMLAVILVLLGRI